MNSDVVLKNATALFASQDRHHRIRSMTQFGDILMGRHAGRSQANPRWKFRKVFAKSPFEYLGLATAQIIPDGILSVCYVRLSGEILLSAERDLIQFLHALKSRSFDELRFQFKDLDSISYSAFWSLVKLAKSARRRGITVELLNHSPAVHELLVQHNAMQYFDMPNDEVHSAKQDNYESQVQDFFKLAA